jgi:hypothetical protein
VENFHLDLRIMKMEVAKVKSLAGLFLEGLMLIFIFVCSQSDFTANDNGNREDPLGKLTSFHQVAFRTTTLCIASIFHTFSRHAAASGEYIISFIDPQGIKLALSDALWISLSERNNFYVLLRDNAP